MNRIADTPAPPYYAVIAPAELSDDTDGYLEMAAKVIEIARQQPGFLGLESAGSGGLLLAVSYWQSLDAIAAWQSHVDHLAAKEEGMRRWFSRYRTRIARVEDAY